MKIPKNSPLADFLRQLIRFAMQDRRKAVGAAGPEMREWLLGRSLGYLHSAQALARRSEFAQWDAPKKERQSEGAR